MSGSTSAIRRLGAELSAMQRLGNRVSDYYASPTEQNIFEWHFTMRGPSEPSCPLSKGLYHGILRFPPSYPFEPPDVIFLTPNGRFDTNKPICTSISKFHKDQWRPSFDVTFVLNSLRHFIEVDDEVGLGSIPKTSVSEEMKLRMAVESWDYYCSHCECKAREIWEKNMCMHPAVSAAAEDGTTRDDKKSASEQSADTTRDTTHNAQSSARCDDDKQKNNSSNSIVVGTHKAGDSSAQATTSPIAHTSLPSHHGAASNDTVAPASASNATVTPSLPHVVDGAAGPVTVSARAATMTAGLPTSSSHDNAIATQHSASMNDGYAHPNALAAVRVHAMGLSLSISLITLDKLIAYSFLTFMFIMMRWAASWLLFT